MAHNLLKLSSRVRIFQSSRTRTLPTPLCWTAKEYSTTLAYMSDSFNGPPYRGGGRGGRGRGRGGGGGGGGRGGGRGGSRYIKSESEFQGSEEVGSPSGKRTQRDLEVYLRGIDGRSYGQYKGLQGSYSCILPVEKAEYTLIIDRIQSDPFAPPSNLRIQILTTTARIPPTAYNTRIAKTAFCDYITRQVSYLLRTNGLDVSQSSGNNWRSPKGGDFGINTPAQQVLERTSCLIDESDGKDTLELRFTLSLPAQGRTIQGQAAAELLTAQLPALVQKGCLWKSLHAESVWSHIRSVRVQEALRGKLEEKGLVAFVGDGAVLPRGSGASVLPMAKELAVPFESPESLRVRIPTGVLDEDGSEITVSGMGIPRGVTVLTGGGFHGKTTLLEALELGVYNVRPGDGRELVVTTPHAIKIRSEDGRNVVSTDITPFINNLPPPHNSTTSFTSTDASGSTSMAANIQEAIELGATTLLIDEDTSATNFLVRDKRMQVLIKSEPISPFVSKAKSLYRDHGVSTIIIIGGCGDYLSIADTVICMDSYHALEITQRAAEVVAQYPVSVEQAVAYGSIPNRVPVLPDFSKYGKSPRAQGTRSIQVPWAPGGNPDKAVVELDGMDQLVEAGQTAVCAEVLSYIPKTGTRCSMREWAIELKRVLDEEGLDAVRGGLVRVGNLVRPRELEILGAVNRVRGLAVVKEGGELVESRVAVVKEEEDGGVKMEVD